MRQMTTRCKHYFLPSFALSGRIRLVLWLNRNPECLDRQQDMCFLQCVMRKSTICSGCDRKVTDKVGDGFTCDHCGLDDLAVNKFNSRGLALIAPGILQPVESKSYLIVHFIEQNARSAAHISVG